MRVVNSVTAAYATPPRATMQRAASAAASLLPLTVLIYSAMLPPEVRLMIGGVAFYAYRIVGFAILPWLLGQFGKGIRLSVGDGLILAASAWMVISFVAFYGVEGFARGVGLAVDVAIPYLCARVSIRSYQDFRRLLIYCLPGLMIAGILIAFESVSHKLVVRPLFASVFGDLSSYENGVAVSNARFFVDYRMGLLRASGPFPHPILGGLFMASFLPLFLRAGLKGWPRYVGPITALFSFFSVSSAVFLAYVMQFGLIIIDVILRFVRLKIWPMIIGSTVILLLTAQVVSGGRLVGFVSRISLNPATAYYRQLIWDYGSQSVFDHPIIGIGFSEYQRLSWMTPSVDNYWLLLGIRHGFLTPVCVFVFCLMFMWKLGQSFRYLPVHDQKLGQALNVSVFTLVVTAFTVSYFSGMQTLFYVLLGAGASLWAVPGAVRAAGPGSR